VFADAEERGRLLSFEQTADLARELASALARQFAVPTQTEQVPEHHLLSRREVQVLQLAAEGLTDKEIALRLNMSRRTATTHQTNIRQKLNVQNRAEAVAHASREGII
jgi:DNA-binding NarL/FixJ family response regulator